MRAQDQRRASRFGVPLEHEAAELRYAGVSHAARLVDQSAGGFALQLECDIDIDRNATAALNWTGGCCQVRVISRIDEPNFIRLGVERMAELDSVQSLDEEPSLWSLWRERLPRGESNYTYCILGMLLLGGIALSALIWQMAPHDSNLVVRAPTADAVDTVDVAAATKAVRKRALKSIDDASAWLQGVGLSTTFKEASLPRGGRHWAAIHAQAVGLAVRSIIGSLAGLPGDARHASSVAKRAASATVDTIREAADFGADTLMLTLPQFMDLLELTPRQHKQLDALLKATHQATQELQQRGRELGTQKTLQEIAAVRKRAAEQVAEILSPAQSERLRSLTAKGSRGKASQATHGTSR